MLYDRENGDIIHQYITFCKVLTEQIRIHGKTRKAIEETLRICRDKKVLEEYLKERETEIMDIMTTLFDQDYVTHMYGIEPRNEGRNEERMNSIRNLMSKLKMCLSDAMAFLEIPKEEQSIYIEALSNEGKKDS